MRGIHRRPVNSPHKGPVTRKKFPFDDVIMRNQFTSLHWNISKLFPENPPTNISSQWRHFGFSTPTIVTEWRIVLPHYQIIKSQSLQGLYIYIYICFSTRSFDASVFMKVAIRICPYVCMSFPGVHPSASAIDAINSSRWPVNSPHKVSVKGAVTPRRVAWTSEYHVDKSWTVTSENERV